MQMLLVLGLVSVLTTGRVHGVPFEVNSRPTCESYFSLDEDSLSGIKRGDASAPCSGYVRLTLSGSERRVCGDPNQFYTRAAQRLCYTLGANYYRDTTEFTHNTRQIQLYECFVYTEQYVESVLSFTNEEIFDTNGLLNRDVTTGCEANQDEPSMYDCFDDCHFTSAPVSGVESDCTYGEPYFAVGCADVNECENGVRDECKGPYKTSCKIRRACGNNTRCTNLHGSYECDCKNGYESKNGDSMDPYDLTAGCKDIDECHEDHYACGHSGQCINTPGSYLCVCPTRELWDDDAKTCTGPICGTPFVDPNARRNDTDGLPGDVVIFHCEEGFTAPDGTSSYTSVCTGGTWFSNGYCTDVNECSSSTCDPHAECFNGPGFVYCRCKAGFSGDGYTCTRVACDHVPEVAHAVASHHAYLPGSYSYEDSATFTCTSGYQVSIQNMPYQLLDYYGYKPTTTFKITCDKWGHWAPNPIPRCLPVFCGDPGILPNSERSGSGFVYEREVKYTCQDGYRAKNGALGSTSFTRTCQQDGQWSEGTTCKDIDECEDHTRCGAEGKYCINTEGSYMCSCVPWYQKDINDNRCVEWAGLVDFPDYQPCHIVDSLGLCKHGDCDVKNGKALCKCKPGYYGVACDQVVMGPALIVAIVGLILLVIMVVLLCMYSCCRARRAAALVHAAPPCRPPAYPTKANLCGPITRWGYNLCGRESLF